ncbi:MAG TPA: hypothetical protein VFI31_13520 [Pirellulales bacterium]|nr:hypothetical protein [Pirellulales bacterium]
MLTTTKDRLPRELADQIDNNAAPLELTLPINDPIVYGYISQFEQSDWVAKATDALKVGVIAIQSASPTLDMRVVHEKFAEVETRFKDFVGDFQQEMAEQFTLYFKDKDGHVPRSLDGFLGQDGRLPQLIRSWFDPADGKLGKLMEAQVGPSSKFARSLDPKNKDGVIMLIEASMQKLLEDRLNDVLAQFSLDEEDSAMSRFKTLLDEGFQKINLALGVKDATAAEAARGHVKGIEFEADLYEVFAETGRQLGDDTEFVRGTPGETRKKVGDFVAILGETAGAPGVKIVVEAKDSSRKLRDAIDELAAAKENRAAPIGIFAFAKGAEPAEVGDFRRIGDDFYCAVDKHDLAHGKPLVFFDAAYKIARALAVAAARREAAGGLDLEAIEQDVQELLAWTERLAEMATKARTIQSSGKFIEQRADELKEDLSHRLNGIQDMLRRGDQA